MHKLNECRMNYQAERRKSEPVECRRILFCLALIILFIFTSPALSTATYDFVGTVLKTTETNGLYVNITQSNIEGLFGPTEILLETPMAELSYYRGQELQFDMLGHDILGRPVCNAYYNGVGIRDAYYCKKNPDQCYNPKRYYAYEPPTYLPTYYYRYCTGGDCPRYGQYDYLSDGPNSYIFYGPYGQFY